MSDTGLVDLLTYGKAVVMSDHFDFACKNCGRVCCTSETPILITPSEKVRLAYRLYHHNHPGMFIDKHPGHNPFTLHIESFAMTASIFINPILDPDFGAPLCPFFCLSETPRDLQGVCGVYADRGNTCRIFPFGRLVKSAYGHMIDKYVAIPAYCPGLGKGPAQQTVGTYLARNQSPEMELEFSIYYRFIYPKFCNAVDMYGDRAARRIGELLFHLSTPTGDLNDSQLHEHILQEYARIENVIDTLKF